jgi:Glyoxalase-like domain
VAVAPAIAGIVAITGALLWVERRPGPVAAVPGPSACVGRRVLNAGMGKPPQIVIDCHDPASLGSFWAKALDYEMEQPPEGFATWPEALTAWGVPESEWNSANAIVDPEGVGPRIFFQRVPEPKQGKNRLHLDIRVSQGPGIPIEEKRAAVHAGAERMESLGATRLGDVEEMGSYWMVMQDPEGNEFCVT